MAKLKCTRLLLRMDGKKALRVLLKIKLGTRFGGQKLCGVGVDGGIGRGSLDDYDQINGTRGREYSKRVSLYSAQVFSSVRGKSTGIVQ